MKNWPDQKLNKSAPHSHYTCAGISNGTQRPNVTFTTEIAIDFPPEDLIVSKVVVNVTENDIPAPVKCSGKGRPKLNYVWKKNSTAELIGKDDTLQLDKMPRSAAGYYTCEAYNKYGNKTANVYFNVLYKPECKAEIDNKDGHEVLTCSAKGNPKDIAYTWRIREGNDTIDYTGAYTQDGVSYVILDSSVENERIYECVANNSVGHSKICHRKILGNLRPWYLDTHNLIVIVASIVTLIICVIIVCIIIIVMCRKKRQNAKSPNPSSTGDKMRLGAAPPVGGSADPANDHDKGFYENLPFHGMQNPPNKPISIIAPFTQDANPLSYSAKSLIPAARTAFAPCSKTIQRHQSFHGFQNNQQMQLTNFPATINFNRNLSNPYLNSWNNAWPNWPNFPNKNFHSQNITDQQVPQPFRFSQPRNNFQPILNFNPFLLPNPFSVPSMRFPGRRETDVRRTASGINISENEKTRDEANTKKNTPISKPEANNDKRFGSLELKKHKCYSPTFYSMRCKKHAKKRPVVYALPKKVFGDLKPTDGNKPVYQDLTDSIQIFEHNTDNNANESPKTVPVPAPRCKKHRKNEIIYQNVSQQIKAQEFSNSDVSNSSNDGSENLESEISVIEAQVHKSKDQEQTESKPENHPRSPPKLVGVSPKPNVSLDSSIIKVEAMKALKNSPMLKVSPNFIKPKTESPKGALSLQIQAKMKNSSDNLNQTDDSSKENLPLIPQMPLLNPQNKWSPGFANANQQNAFYTLTTPHYKHMNIGLPPQYSATIPHQKHTKLIPRALFNEQLPKSKSFSSKPKHKKHFQIPLQKCHSFKFQTAESYFQPIKNIHEEDLMKNGYVSDYPESSRGRHHKRPPKQKTKGPLVLRRPNDYHENVHFTENVQNSVQLQYPQPVLGRSMKKPNGVVYADLDMPKTKKKSSHETSSSSQSKSQKSKPKTEYATLSFNEIGQEIDV